MKKMTERTIISLLLSGKHPQAKKYAGHHVMVVKDEILPLNKGQTGLQEMKQLEKKYGKTPTLVFVPRQDISYILLCFT